MDTTKLRCIVCNKPMDDIDVNQPSGGTAFHTEGHYGSSVTDHMDGTITTLFVCDFCMMDAINRGVAREDKSHGF